MRELRRISVAAALGVLACGLLAGCGAAPAPDGLDEAALPPLEVIADIDEISSARERFAIELRSLISEEGLSRLSYIDLDTETLLERNRETVLPELRALLEGATTPEPVRLAAAVLEAELTGASGIEAAAPFVHSDDPAVVQSALDHLRFPSWDDRDHAIPSSAHPALLSLMNSDAEEVRRDALFLCARYRVPGVTRELERILQEGTEQERLEACYWLSEIAPTPEHLQVSIDLYPRVDRNARVLTALTGYLESESPAVRSRATEFLVEVLTPRLTEGLLGLPQSEIADVLRAGSGPAARELMEQVLSVSNDDYLRGLALEGIARMDGLAARHRLLQSLEDVGVQSQAASALAELYRGSEDPEISAALLALARSDLASRRRAGILEALITLGRTKDDPAILGLVERLDPADRQPFYASSFEDWLERFTSRLNELGVVPAERAQEVRRVWLARPYEVDPDIDVFGFLSDCGVVVAFDAETGTIPVRHDLLLYQFADASGGTFAPEAPFEAMNRSSPDDYDGDYAVQFIANGRLYRFGARNFGDWYDVEAVHRAVNRALSDAGVPERFVPVDTRDQTAVFLFAPAAVSVLAEEFGIPLSTDPNRAVTTGKEYEQHVLDELGSRERRAVAVE